MIQLQMTSHGNNCYDNYIQNDLTCKEIQIPYYQVATFLDIGLKRMQTKP